MFWFLLPHSKIFLMLSTSKQQFIAHDCMGWLGPAVRLFLGIPHAVVIQWWPGLELTEGSAQLSIPEGSLTVLSVDAGSQLRAQLNFQLESVHVDSLGNLVFSTVTGFSKGESKMWVPRYSERGHRFLMSHHQKSQNIFSAAFYWWKQVTQDSVVLNEYEVGFFFWC